MASPTDRPLSPHLQIYHLPLTALLSITHRITGVILSLGLVGLVAILLAIAGGGGSYDAIHSFMNGILGQGFTLLWLLALFVHFCHGIRHLIWDTVAGFEPSTLTRHSGWELTAAVMLTLISWFFL